MLIVPFPGPSAAPLNLTGFMLSSRSVQLSWDPPPVTDQNGIISGYTVVTSSSDDGESFYNISAYMNMTVNSLSPYTTYAFSVAASTAAGRGPFSAKILVQTLQEGIADITAYIIAIVMSMITFTPFSSRRCSSKCNWRGP